MITHHTIRPGDARDLRGIASASIDLLVTSPPYPMIGMWDEIFTTLNPAIGRALAAGDGARAFELMHRELDRAWRQATRVLRPGGVACINIGDATRSVDGSFSLFSNHARVVHQMLQLGFSNLPGILWRKQTNAPTKFMGSGMLPAGAYITLEHEHILVFRKEGKRMFSLPEEKARRRASAFFWEERNAWFSDLWDFKGTGQRRDGSPGRGRSGAFPFELPYRLINMYSLMGDTVLDPFAGTGTTMRAAIAAGRNSIGVEIDGDMAACTAAGHGTVEAANRRLRLRIEEHRSFVRRRQDLSFRYINTAHDVPVMTRQETDLVIRPLLRVTLLDSTSVEAEYGEGARKTT